ncbi:MAG: hypothetical protein ACJ77R_11385, partial [Gemmatimonadaceae bacterium]
MKWTGRLPEVTSGQRHMTAPGERSILVLNVGSSTLKFGLFPASEGDDAQLQGVLEYSSPGKSGRLQVSDSKGRTDSREIAATRDSAAAELLRYLKQDSLLDS